MNIRLENILEEKLSYYADKLHVTKTDLDKPYIIRLLEDLEDYHNASQALKEEGAISLTNLEKKFKN